MTGAKAPLTPTDVVCSLTATVERRWKRWLAAPEAAGTDSVAVPLHPPTGRDAAADVTAAENWVRSWQQWASDHPAADVEWVEKSWSAAGLGRQRVPDRVRVSGVEALITVTGTSRRWRDLTRRLDLLLGEAPDPGVRAAAAAVMTKWTDLTQEDLDRVRGVVDWFLENPASGLLPRAIPVEGVHGKWFEHHRALIFRLVSAYRGSPDGTAVSSLSDLGLQTREPLVRLRLPTGLPESEVVAEDITLTWSGAAALWSPQTVPVTGVLMVENLETFLALPRPTDLVLLWGAGYTAVQWSQLPWLAGLRVWYWGDLDADGFAVLSGVRSHLPHTESVLMDGPTVRRWQHLATSDPRSDRRNLPFLTAEEEAARDLLVSSGRLRIEQERILLSEAVSALTEAGVYLN